MIRRNFITLLGGAAAVWPLAAWAQQGERVRRVGVLTNLAADDAEGQVRNTAFAQALAQLGWIVGQNLQIEHRWAAGDADRIRRYAAELVALTPDVILTTGAAGVAPLLQATRTVPVVFVLVPDPVGSGFVASLARPGGNATGFVQFEYGISGKWLELLKEIAPGVARVAVLRDPAIAGGQGQVAAIQAVAPSFGMEVTPINVRDTGEMERAIAAFAHTSRDGLIVTASALTVFHRDLIVTLAARYKLPTVYVQRLFVASGGLISYGADVVDQYRRAANYVDRILKGEKPADLPVQSTDQVRARDQPQNREGARPRRATFAARPRRRGDRMMQRREFITLLGGAAAAWPLAARAQQGERMRRVGVLMLTRADEPESQARIAAFMQGLQELGWAIGRNLRIDYRWGGGDAAPACTNTRRNWSRSAQTSILAARRRPSSRCNRRARTVPIVFAQAIDPVGAGFVETLARPGSNATGFLHSSTAWLENGWSCSRRSRRSSSASA